MQNSGIYPQHPPPQSSQPTGSQSGYPPSSQTGYNTQQSGYPQPPSQGGYPQSGSGPSSQPTYPPSQPPSSQSGYPPPSSQSGYPPQAPTSQSGYPQPPSQSGYPPQAPTSQSGYQGGYTQAPSGYPQQPPKDNTTYDPKGYPGSYSNNGPSSGYPPQAPTSQPGYPPSQQPYPSQSSYPPSQQPYSSQPGYPPSQQSYPSQSGYPPSQQPYSSQPGYPPSQQPYASQRGYPQSDYPPSQTHSNPSGYPSYQPYPGHSPYPPQPNSYGAPPSSSGYHSSPYPQGPQSSYGDYSSGGGKPMSYGGMSYNPSGQANNSYNPSSQRAPAPRLGIPGSSTVGLQPGGRGAPQHQYYSHSVTTTTTRSPAGGYGQQQQQHHPEGLSFFSHLHLNLARDYVLVVDKSGSMAGGLWRQAGEAVGTLAPSVCKADPDGITLYFFSGGNNFPKYENISDPAMVDDLFRREKPSGTTNLAGVLRAAFDEHFRKNKYNGEWKPTTILVITDGEPDNKKSVEDVIRQATFKMDADEDLSVSFIQIGHDRSATKFLQHLDDDIQGVKFDIVDALTVDEMNNMSFVDLIKKSVFD